MTKEKKGTVSVKNGRYKFEGKFHAIDPNTPIRDEKNILMGITNPRDMVYVHAYGGEALFFESLSKGKLMATRCDNKKCKTHGSIYLPFRIHCPDCLGKTTEVDITGIAQKTGKLHTFMVTERTGAFNTLKTPIKFINIEIEGVVTILMSYLSVGEPKIGTRVVPIFQTKNPTFTILDLSWVPEGTTNSELPEGFTFM